MSFNDLRHEQARQIIDAEQVYAAYRAARAEHDTRYAGSMSWKRVNGGTYLYRKVRGSNRSLGPRSDATETAYAAFHEGRDRLQERVSGLAKRLDEMAPVNRALGLGRVPTIGARILRAIDAAGLMGKAVEVVGTNALFAYERLAAVQVESGLLATGDVDLLFDARRNLKIAAPGIVTEGLLGLLRKVDRSFALTGRGSFRAANDAGYLVDLIKPVPKDPFSMVERTSLGGRDDIQAVEIEGLQWLVNSPKQKAVVFDERGYPFEMSVPDPRAFAVHKAWLSSRPDREPIKRRRDDGQARLVAALVAERILHLAFDGGDLTALPIAMRRSADRILNVDPDGKDAAASRIEPDW